jgi:deoxyribose-phosphate aldolase
MDASDGRCVKVIIETCLLTKEEKILASNIVKNSGADFIKTSRGYSIGGATIDDVRLIRETVGREMGVKASGGIKTLVNVKQMIDAGADRIGTSSAVEIVS